MAQVSLTAFQDWGADIGVQWDPENQRSERTLLNVQYKPADNKIINFAYRYERFQYVQPDPDQPGVTPYWQGFDQLELSGAWPIRNNWDLFLRDVYALRDYSPIGTQAGAPVEELDGNWSALSAYNTAPAAGGCAWASAAS